MNGSATNLTLRRNPTQSGTVTVSGVGPFGGMSVFPGYTVQVLDVTFTTTVRNSGALTLTRVRVSGINSQDSAITNSGQLVATDSEISDNVQQNRFPLGIGGAGIYNDTGGTMTLTNVLIRNNTGSSGGGGGIKNRGTLTLQSVRIIANSASSGGQGGGGILNWGNLNGTNVEVSGNSAGFRGGGVANTEGGTASLNNSVIRNNTVNFSGGGLNHSSTGVVTLTNTLITGNEARLGGGVSGSGSLVLRSTMITRNAAIEDGGGVYGFSSATLDRQLSLITGNTPNNCAGGVTC